MSIDEKLKEFDKRLQEAQRRYEEKEKQIKDLKYEKDAIGEDIEDIIREMQYFKDNLFELLSFDGQDIYSAWVW